MMLRPRLTVMTCALLAITARVASSRADDPEVAQQAMFDQATRDMNAGAYDKACPTFAEVVKLSGGIGAMIALGTCYAHEGKLASAWAMFKKAADAAHLAQDVRENEAVALAEQFFPRVSRLTITLGAGVAGVAGLTIKRDEVELAKAQWNTDVPADAGKHEVTAAALGKKPWKGSVEVPGSGGRATLEVPALEDEPPAAAPPAPISEVTLRVSGGDNITLTPSTGAPKSCKAPCSLKVPVGEAKVDVANDDRWFRKGLTVSSTSRELDVSLRKSRVPLWMTLLIVGCVPTPIGIAVAAKGASQSCAAGSCSGPNRWEEAAGTVIAGAGGVMVIAGTIGLATLGHDNARIGQFVPRVTITPSGLVSADGHAWKATTGTLTWRF